MSILSDLPRRAVIVSSDATPSSAEHLTVEGVRVQVSGQWNDGLRLGGWAENVETVVPTSHLFPRSLHARDGEKEEADLELRRDRKRKIAFAVREEGLTRQR